MFSTASIHSSTSETSQVGERFKKLKIVPVTHTTMGTDTVKKEKHSSVNTTRTSADVACTYKQSVAATKTQ